jgi:hypothetical protein
LAVILGFNGFTLELFIVKCISMLGSLESEEHLTAF